MCQERDLMPSHYKPMDLSQFEKLVKQAGWTILPSKSHHYIADENGVSLLNFAIFHSKGRKRYIKPHYVKTFLQLLKQEGKA
jgi:hypothetical protein